MIVVMSAPMDSPAPASSPPPSEPRSRRALWAEMVAVLAVGVVPHLVGSSTAAIHPRNGGVLPYWLDTYNLTLMSLCTAYVVVYLIRRSSEPFSRFGFSAPNMFALLFIPVVLLAIYVQVL